MQEGAGERSDALVSGDAADWVAALSPDGARAGLAITGNRALAEALLDDLGAGGAEVSRAASAAA